MQQSPKQIYEAKQNEFILPQMKTDSYNEIPIGLQQLNNWIVWRLESRKGKKY